MEECVMFVKNRRQALIKYSINNSGSSFADEVFIRDFDGSFHEVIWLSCNKMYVFLTNEVVSEWVK